MTTIDSMLFSASSSEPSRFRTAYEKVLPAMMALTTEQLLAVTVDIPSAVATVLGSWPGILKMRGQIATHLPTFDLARFDMLPELTQALGHAQSEYLSVTVPTDELPAMNERAVRMRELFLGEAHTLMLRGLLTPGELAEFKGLTGYKIAAFELMGLAGLMLRKWATIEGKTGLQKAELEEAERLGETMIDAVGVRERGALVVAEKTQLRQRAFTLFIRAYNDAGWAIEFLRREQEDADSIIPSLYLSRGRRSKADRNTTEPATPVQVTPAQPTATTPAGMQVGLGMGQAGAGLGMGQAGLGMGQAGAGVPAFASIPAVPAVPGGPGGSPFVR